MQKTGLYPHCDGAIFLRTCDKEVITPIGHKLESGCIPHWINGKLFQNGPGALKIGDDKEFGHMFDNFGLIHCFSIANGDVSYQCRFVESEYYKKIRAKRLLITEFGTKSVNDPCNTIFHRIKTVFQPQSDNAMISIYPFEDEMYAFGESPIIHRIDAKSLATTANVNFRKTIGIVNHSAHPHQDHDGNTYNIATAYTHLGRVVHHVVCFPRKKTASEMFASARIVATVPARKAMNPSYMHSFGMSENYFVFVQQPLSISIAKLVRCKMADEPLITSLCWDAERKTRIDVISRVTGHIEHSFYTRALFFLHIINCYEVKSEHQLVIDICAYKNAEMVNCMYTEALQSLQTNSNYAKLFRGRPKRFILPLHPLNTNDNLVEGEVLCHWGCETPQINYARCVGRFYQYFYAINSDVDHRYPGAIIKVDVVNGRTWSWAEDNCYASEPIFIAHPHAINEDDGVIVASIIWGERIDNFIGILILNATNMKEIARRIFQTPSAAPKCLHGWFKSGNDDLDDNTPIKRRKTC